MLKKFELKNYKNFKDCVTVDFGKVGGYKYNKECLSNELIGKMIIYGRNATGKTNLGKAILNISKILDSNGLFKINDSAYLNADSGSNYAEYSYTFKFESDELIYKYNKIEKDKLLDEQLILNGKECFYYNFESKESRFENLSYLDAETVVVERYTNAMNSTGSDDDENVRQTLPFLRWLIGNTAMPKDSVLLKLNSYIKGMTMLNSCDSIFRQSLQSYQIFYKSLSEKKALKNFEVFLNVMGIECELDIKELPDGNYQLYFKHEKLVPFLENASSGTLAITKLYRRFEMGRKTSFVYIDEFDAYYHYEMSEKVIEFFKNKYTDCQMIMTTHNTNLMSNKIMRPDCLFILSVNGQLTALNEATGRELREGHNLEKMYIAGEFGDYE